jgi:hypothetical protein
VWACPPTERGWHNAVDPDYKKAAWVNLSDLQPGWYVRLGGGPYAGWSGQIDDDSYFHGLMEGDGSLKGKWGVMELHGHAAESLLEWTKEYLLYRGVRYAGHSVSSENGVRLEWCDLTFKIAHQSWRMSSSPWDLAGYVRGIADAEGHVSESNGNVVIVGADISLGRKLQYILLLFGVKCSFRVYPPCPEQGKKSSNYRLSISGVNVVNYARSIGFSEELKARKLQEIVDRRLSKRATPHIPAAFWWDRVKSVAKCGQREFVGITTSTGSYIGDGFVCHNSGKSVVGAIRFAAIATDRSVFGPDGQQVDVRLPWQKGRPLIMWCIGLGQGHIGQTLHRLLFRPGAFKIIRDQKTGAWRAYRPWDAGDAAREKEAKPSPPLIPQRFINPNGWGWENKAERVFTQCEIWHPETHEPLAYIYAFTSSGDVKAGDPIDEIWVDERIKFPQYYAEWQARLIDNKGRLTWTSWPDITNYALMDVSRRAKDAEQDESPQVVEVVFKSTQNPHLDADSIRIASDGWSDEERRARIEGEFVTDTLRMYSNFDPTIHRAIAISSDGDDDLSRILRSRNGEPPEDWTRELVLDPGTSFPAVLLCAIPPEELGDYFVPYREIYIPRLTADMLATRVLAHTQGYFFERFIIDPNAGRQTPMGFNVTVAKNYTRAFEELGLRCRQSGAQFTPGSNDVAGRILQLQSWMTIGPRGFPRLRIVVDNCPSLCMQLERYVKDAMSNVPNEFKPAKGQKLDLAVCLEYWASRNPEWIPPRIGKRRSSEMQSLYERLRKTYDKKKKEDGSLVLGPARG